MFDLLRALWTQLLLQAALRSQAKERLTEGWRGGRATARIRHYRPARRRADGSPDPASYELLSESVSHNLITNGGRDFLHNQGYGTTALGANGLNYIALSDDAVTETAASTTLSNEITTNGLGRAQGSVAHTAGTNLTLISKTFNVSGASSVRKTALFTAGAGGIMNHVLGFPPRSLVNLDTLTVEIEISLG